MYRLSLAGGDKPEGKIRFQLSGNHWLVQQGHSITLEISQTDALYRPDNFPSSIVFSSPEVLIPTVGKAKKGSLEEDATLELIDIQENGAMSRSGLNFAELVELLAGDQESSTSTRKPAETSVDDAPAEPVIAGVDIYFALADEPSLVFSSSEQEPVWEDSLAADMLAL